MSSQMELTKEEIRAEIREKTTDLNTFIEARKLIRERVLEVSDSNSRLTPLPQWSGTDAVLGSLDLCIHSMERTIEELRGILTRLDEETPHLRLVRNEEKN
jgi:hypothetical protein